VAFSLALALLACVPETETQKQVRELEARLRPFPPAKVVRANLEISSRHLAWLQEVRATMPAHRRETMAAQIAEAERLHTLWTSLNRATIRVAEAKSVVAKVQQDKGSGSYKFLPEVIRFSQRCLDTLEELLGPANFGTGRMPPPVPVWRFQWVE
jgi:hypothetical protein